MIENKATDLIAKLLANENISVIMARTSTASFNIETRVLTLPQWKETTPEITGMLVGHEVGHALYTTNEYYTHDIKESHFQGYLNVLEDVRIEKLMKKRYPGLRKTFAEGYKQLNDQDFFDVKSTDLNDMLLIDRINLYFKAGYACGVSFTREEKNFVDRAEKTETIQDVIDLAKEIYEVTKEEIEKKKEEADQAKDEEASQDEETSDPDEDEDGDSYEYEEIDDLDGEAERTSSSSETSEEISEDDGMESKTERAYQKNVEDLADTSIEYRYYKFGKFQYDPIIGYKQILDSFETVKEIHSDTYLSNKEEVANFKSSSSNVVNYLVKEFEMKKAATIYKRAQESKVGQLDTRKLASYKLKDDIFKRVTTFPAGKNHGMVMLLDWSGSMSNCIKETLDQVINLAMFCARSQIPYQVFAFSDGIPNSSFEKFKESWKTGNYIESLAENDIDVNRGYLSLVELFSNKMSTSEFNRMIEAVKHNHFQWILPLNGTPLNEALVYMYDYLPKFKQRLNVEKMTFITLTDGQGTALRSVRHIETMRWDNENSKKVQIKNFINDPITKKNYTFSNNSSDQTNAILNMIKEAHDVTTLGFYLTGTSYRNVASAVSAHLGWSNSYGNTVDRMRKEMRSNGYSTLKGTGRDDLFIVPLSSTKIIDQNLDKISSDNTAAQIARQFGKVLNTKKTSRILLNKFIDYIA